MRGRNHDSRWISITLEVLGVILALWVFLDKLDLPTQIKLLIVIAIGSFFLLMSEHFFNNRRN